MTKKKFSPETLLAATPLFLWLSFFLVAPLALVFVYSFFQRGPYGNLVYDLTLANYVRVFDPLYASIFMRSVALASLATVVCVVIGFPMALGMATARKSIRPWLFLGLMIPFLANFVVRVYAIRILLSIEGPINSSLLASGLLTTPLVLNDSMLGIVVGMITNYLPFMVLPIYVVLEKLDFSLVEAAADLGASWRIILVRVVLPLARPGIVSGSALVSIPMLGEFMIPDLLGGAKNMLIGNLITEQFIKARDWPFGAALAMTLIGFMFLMLLMNNMRGLTTADGRLR